MRLFRLSRLSICLILITLNSFAQSSQTGITVKGLIIDKSNNSQVMYCSVVIENEKGKVISGGLTDDKGIFSLPKIPVGVYKLKVSFMGYNSIEKAFKVVAKQKIINLGSLFMYPNTQSLEEVVVKSEKRFIQNKIDKKVINVSESVNAMGVTATEVLENVPSVEIDVEGNVKLRGNSNVRVLLDGKPTGFSAAELLQQLPADGIEKIEIITNPSVKFNPEGMSGIINIILKKDKLVGFNSSISTSFGAIGTKSNDLSTRDIGINSNYRNGKMNIFGRLNWRQNKRIVTGINNRKVFNSTVSTFRNQNSKGDRWRNGITGQIGFDYYINKNNVFTLSTNLRKGGNSLDRKLNISEYKNIIQLGNENGIWETKEDEEGINNTLTLNANHELKFNKGDGKLVTDMNFITRKKLYEQNISTKDIKNSKDSPKRATTRDIEGTDIRFSSDYENKLAENIKIETGVNIELSENVEDYQAFIENTTNSKMTENNKVSNHFTYIQNVYALYGIWGHSFKDLGLSYKLGLRSEYVTTSSELRNDNSTIPNNNYFSTYPSVHIQKMIGERDELQLSYSRRVSRPSRRALNPFIDYTDTLNLHIGNPKLRPEYTNSVELGYTHYWDKSSLISSIFYRHTTDVILRVGKQDPKDPRISIVKRYNIASTSDLGLELIYSNRVLQWWNFNINGQAYWVQTDGGAEGQSLDNKVLNWSFSVNNQFRYKGFSGQVSGRYRPQVAYAQSKIHNMWSINAGIRKSFMNKSLSVGLKLRDVFDSRRFLLNVHRTGYEAFKEFDWSNRELLLSVRYNFGNLKLKKRKTKRYKEDTGGAGRYQI